DAHPFDEAADEAPLAHPRPQRRHPLLLVGAEQFRLAALVARLPQPVAARPGALDLGADELAARVAALLQPVGVEQAPGVIVGILDDGLDESLLGAHAGSPGGR